MLLLHNKYLLLQYSKERSSGKKINSPLGLCCVWTPTAPLISQSLLDPHFTGRSPISVIIGCEIWAYRGIGMSQHLEITVIVSVLYIQLETECPFSMTRVAQVLFTVFIVSADLGDQSIGAFRVLWREAPSSIICQGFPEQEGEGS